MIESSVHKVGRLESCAATPKQTRPKSTNRFPVHGMPDMKGELPQGRPDETLCGHSLLRALGHKYASHWTNSADLRRPAARNVGAPIIYDRRPGHRSEDGVARRASKRLSQLWSGLPNVCDSDKGRAKGA